MELGQSLKSLTALTLMLQSQFAFFLLITQISARMYLKRLPGDRMKLEVASRAAEPDTPHLALRRAPGSPFVCLTGEGQLQLSQECDDKSAHRWTHGSHQASCVGRSVRIRLSLVRYTIPTK